MSDSTTQGYIVPLAGTEPLEDQSLEDILQAMLVGVTGLPGTLVRPRWQSVPPAQPAVDVDWAAFGISSETPDANAYVRHDPAGGAGLGTSQQQRHEDVALLVTFYGPHGQAMAKRLTMGLGMAQNREILGLAGIKLKQVGTAQNLSELINFQNVRRVDIEVQLRRIVTTDYAIRSLASLTATVADEKASVTVNLP